MKQSSALEAFVPLKRGLSREEAAFIVGVGTNLFDRMVVEGQLPRSKKLGGRVLWDRIQIDRAMDKLFDSGVDKEDDKEVVNEWSHENMD